MRGNVGGWVAWTVLLLACGPGERPEQDAVSQASAAADLDGAAGALRWVRIPQEVSGSEAINMAQDVTLDSQGDAIIAGWFAGGLDLGSGPLDVGLLPGGRALLAKFSARGKPRWVRVFHEASSRMAAMYKVAVDASRNITVFGTTQGPIDLGGGFLPRGAFLARFDAEGRHLWSRSLRAPEPGRGWLSAQGLETDHGGNIILAGDFEGVVDLGTGPLSSGLTATAYLARFTPEGQLLWLNTHKVHYLYGLAVDSQDNLFTLEDSVAGKGESLRKFSPDGALLFQTKLPFGPGARGLATGVYARAHVVAVVGTFSGTLPFASQTLVSRGPSDAFVMAFGGGGRHLWARGFGHAGDSVSVTGEGEVVATGRYSPGDDFGQGPVEGLPSFDRNLFVIKLDPVTGATRWVRAFPAHGLMSTASATTRAGESVVAGWGSPLTDFGTGAGVPAQTSLFLLRLAP